MSVNTIIGQAATGDNFFPRPDTTKLFWDRIKSGNNILIAAPRRVGKTSLMKHFKDKPEENFELIYIITESINNGNEFFKKLFKEIVSLLKSADKYKTHFKRLLDSKTISSISTQGISFDSVDTDYFDEFKKAMKLIDMKDEKLILLIDEFSQTVENIIKDEGERKAIIFLEQNREIRQLYDIENKIQFVYAGSIGLENIVGKINAAKTINDLYSLDVPPLKHTQAKELISKITDGSELSLDNDALDYILKRIAWFIPYYIQIIIDEIDRISDIENRPVLEKDIDEAFNNALSRKTYFQPWFNRLRTAYKGDEFNFAKSVLNHTAENAKIDKNVVHDFAVKYNLESLYIDIINSLKHDGYIVLAENNKFYRFNSPLLQAWWNQNIAF